MKTPRQKLIKKLDTIWSRIVRKAGVCEAISRPGACVGSLQAAHIIRRGNNSVRWDIDNGLCLCVKHHYWFDKGDKFEVTEWFNRKWPGRQERLKEVNQITHYKLHDLENIYARLKEINLD